jgi:protein-disulfide isomerase
MRAQVRLGAITLPFLLAACGNAESDLNAVAATQAAPLPQIAAPGNGDWTEIVTRTPEGGALMGNPNAPVKLVEYGSMSCPACKAFSHEATAGLRDSYVRSGQVSWEFRSYLRNAPDVALSLLLDCQPPAAYFRTVEQVYTQQSELLGAIDEAEGQRIGAMPPEQQVPSLARAMELDTFFARRGMPESRFAQCLADPQAVRRLTDATSRAMTEQQVSGTPTFFINGERQDTSGWRGIEPRLRAALGR